MGGSRCAAVVAIGVTLSTGPVHAEPALLLSAEAPGAVPLDAPQEAWFGPGGMPAVALYGAASAWLLGGVRLRVGLLADGEAPRAGLMDPGVGGLGSLTLAARLRPWVRAGEPGRGTGPWLEAAAGAAVTGDLVRPTFEVGAGWGFPVGRINLGPALRYLHVVQPDDALDGRDAHLALLGVELSILDRRPAPPTRPEVPAPVMPPPPPPPADSDGDGLLDRDDRCPAEPEDADGFADEDGCPDPDNDGDGITDADDACPLEPEVVNGVDDGDGCADEGLFQVVEDRIILEERVLFSTNRARVRRAGRNVLRAFLAFWREHPEWERVVIEGHSDERGDERHNQWLSEERARRVRDALVELGVDPARLEIRGHGESKPRDHRHGRPAWERNRRVEFELVRQRSAPAAQPPEGTP